MKAAKKRAKKLDGEAGQTSEISLEDCPSWADIVELAQAVENVWPSYGYNAVMLAAGTGVRGGELLAFRVEDFDLEAGTVAVTRQLDRYQDWPATRLPKGGKTRQTVLWAHLDDVAKAAIDSAGPDGWLFPRPDDARAKKWLTKMNKVIEGVIEDIGWDWTLHWTRHLYCSLSIAPGTSGGYGLDPSSVARWAGHGDLATFLNVYVQPQQNSVAHARASTSATPTGEHA